jgi:hypothetical protein
MELAGADDMDAAQKGERAGASESAGPYLCSLRDPPIELRSNLREVQAKVHNLVGEVCNIFLVTEGVRFELTRPFGLPVFKTGAFNRSATPP